jgi:hypothetical protein
MTHRVRDELLPLRNAAPNDDSGIVFGIKDTVKRALVKCAS